MDELITASTPSYFDTSPLDRADRMIERIRLFSEEWENIPAPVAFSRAERFMTAMMSLVMTTPGIHYMNRGISLPSRASIMKVAKVTVSDKTGELETRYENGFKLKPFTAEGLRAEDFFLIFVQVAAIVEALQQSLQFQAERIPLSHIYIGKLDDRERLVVKSKDAIWFIPTSYHVMLLPGDNFALTKSGITINNMNVAPETRAQPLKNLRREMKGGMGPELSKRLRSGIPVTILDSASPAVQTDCNVLMRRIIPPPANQAQEQKVHNVLQSHPKSIQVERFDAAITGSSFNRLQPNEYLDDEVINFYIESIKDRSCYLWRAQDETWEPCYAFNSFLAERLNNPKTRKYDQLSRWAAKIPGGAKRISLFILPVNKENTHWFLVLVHVPTRVISIVDSIASKIQNPFYQKTIKYIKEYFQIVLNLPLDTPWTEKVTPSRQQPNAVDCGVYTVVNAVRASFGCGFMYPQTLVNRRALALGMLEYATPFEVFGK